MNFKGSLQSSELGITSGYGREFLKQGHGNKASMVHWTNVLNVGSEHDPEAVAPELNVDVVMSTSTTQLVESSSRLAGFWDGQKLLEVCHGDVSKKKILTPLKWPV